MSYSPNLGFINNQNKDFLAKNNQDQWDANFRQIKNLNPPSNDNDAVNKFYSDQNSVSEILLDTGDLLTVNINANPKIVSLPVGVDNQLLVVDSVAPNGLSWQFDLIDLGDHTHLVNARIEVDSINKVPGSPALILEDKIIINRAGADVIFQIGDILSPNGTQNVELVLESKRDASIFLQGDADKVAQGDSTFISHTIHGNALFAGLSLDKGTRQFHIQTADDGTVQNLGLVFETGGNYLPTDGRPLPENLITAMTIDNLGQIEIPTSLDVLTLTASNLNIDSMRFINKPHGSARQIIINSVTLTPNQILSGFIQAEATLASTYTMPSSADLVNTISNPIVGQWFEFVLFNKSTYIIKMAHFDSSQVILTPIGLGNVFKDVQPLLCGKFLIILTNITASNEAIEIISVVL